MTPEQRELLERFEGKRLPHVAAAIRAALDENAALRKALDELGAPTEPDAMCAELVKCGTFTAEAQTASDTIRIGKDLYDALRRDRERLDKLERLHDDGPWPDYQSAEDDGPAKKVWTTSRRDPNPQLNLHVHHRTIREAIDAIEVKP